MRPEEAQSILDSADLIFDESQVQAAVARLAREITAAMAETNPLVLAVMGGATIFAGHLLPQLRFPLEYDYLHVTRYGNATTGGGVNWIVQPRMPLVGRNVLLLDDILDEGITLNETCRRIMDMGAARCVTAVFADKDIGRAKPIVPDFVGLTMPNRFVFGFGMDIKGAWRNLPAIYAVA